MQEEPSATPPTSETGSDALHAPDDVSWRIGEWWVEPKRLLIRRDGEEARRLEPKVMELLVFLADRAPDVVGRDEIFDRVWQGRAVVDGVLSRAVSLLRRALDDDPRRPRYVETIPRQGYRLAARVQRGAEPSLESEGAPVPALVETSSLEVREDSPRRRLGRGGIAWLIAGLVLASAWIVLRPELSSERPQDEVAKPASAARAPVRIAVLPLDFLGAETADRFVADGLTEELIHQLSTVQGLGVVSRTSSSAAKVDGASAREIARRLRLDYLLEGSVTTSDRRLRVTLQLIAADRDEHVWSRTFDRAVTDILELHREIARHIAEQVEVETVPRQGVRSRLSEIVDGEAYRLYLKSLQLLGLRTRASVRESLELLGEAVERDSGLGPAWAATGRAHLLSELYLSVPQAQAYARAQAAVDRALSLDPSLATAHVSLGLLRLSRDWDWSGAEASYRTAIRLQPSFALAHQWLSELLSLAGRHDEALRSVAAAAELDPLSPLVHAAWGQRLNASGRHREALERFAAADALGARFSWHWREVGYARQRLGDVDGALAAHVERMDRRGFSDADLELAVQREGLVGFWRWQYVRLSRTPGTEPVLLAEALVGSGDPESAWPWLEAAVAKRGLWFLHVAKSPAFDDMRSSPRFQRLLDEARP